MLVTKPQNLSPTVIFDDYTLEPNSINTLVADISAPKILTLPDLDVVIGGFPVYVKNAGSAILEIDSSIGAPLYSLSPGDSVFLYADADAAAWQTFLGPIGSTTASITGPVTSTNDAVAVWDGTGGNMLKDTNVTVVGNTISTPSGNLGLNAATSVIDFNGCQLINIAGIGQGAFDIIPGTKMVVVGNITTGILTLPTQTNRGYTARVVITILNETNGSDTGSVWCVVRAKNIGGTVTAYLFAEVESYDASLSSVVFSITTAGVNVVLQTSGIAGITTGYRAIATSMSVPF